MTEPILRATTVDDEVWEDPSEDALFMFMEELRAGGSPLRVERLEEGRESEWAVVRRKENGLYEFTSDMNVSYVSSSRNIHDFLTRWAFDLLEK